MSNYLLARESTDADALDASVIVCTYNRCESLADTLQALAQQQLDPETRWELIVVDNNSRDDTRAVVKRFAASGAVATVRYVFEATQGLSHARNRGIKESDGEVLLFTDDDVRPEPDWMRRILDGMIAHRCHACGGYIAPDWEVPPPPWLTERFHGFLAIRTGSTDTFRVTSRSDAPFGANMAFRRTAFKEFGVFDVALGRKGNVLSSGEDGELFERLLSGGAMVMFFGDARVHHRVDAFRITKRYFRRWRYDTSRNIALHRGLPGARRLFGIPLYIFPQLARACTSALKARFTQSQDEAFYREIIIWHFLGALSGLMQARKRDDNRDSLTTHESRLR